MPNLYLLKGLPASGKSTWAKAEVAKNPHGVTRINKDDLRAMLHGGVWGKDNEREIICARNALIKSAMEMRKNIIIDDTNLNPSHEADIREMCKNTKYAFLVRKFDTPLEECIERDSKRENPVGEKVIRDMYNKYIAEKTIEQPKYEFADKSLTTVVMCDIDGTIAYMNGRGPYDTNVETDGYYMDIIELVKDTKLPIVFMSGRKAITNAETGLWLLKKFKPSTIVGLFMRSDNDDRRDDIVKKELYDNHIKGKYNVKYVFDDRNRVVDMWRKEGLRCLQVQEGDF